MLDIRLRYYTRSKNNSGNRNRWKYLATGENSYLRKNCEKLYWTNWIKTTNCATSLRIMSRRSCVDCDGDALEQKICDATGRAVEEADCNNFWGNWTEGLCVTTSCTTVGELVRTRLCLYDEGLEAINVMLCSNGNQSAIMSEECINATIPAECLPQTSSGTGDSNNMGFYIGIRVAVALIVVLCILHVLVRYQRHKSPQFPPNNTANPNLPSYEFANATVKTSQDLDNVSRPVELSQQHPADAYHFANPTTSENHQSIDDLISAKQNKPEIESVEKPVAYDIAQIDRSNAQRFVQVPDQDVYEISTPGDPNVYYSSLQSSGDVVESTYSKLER